MRPVSSCAPQLPLLLTSTAVHSTVYIVVKRALDRVLPPDVKNDLLPIKAVSALAALVSVGFGVALVSDEDVSSDVIRGNNRELRLMAANWITGYFLYDTLVLYLPKLLRIPRNIPKTKYDGFDWMIVHHGFILALWPLTVMSDMGSFFMGIAYLMELSTPLVHARYFFAELGRKNSAAYVFTGVGMVVSFFLCRIAMAPFIFYKYALQKNATTWAEVFDIPLHCQAGTALMVVMNCIWFYKMVKGAIRAVSKLLIKARVE